MSVQPHVYTPAWLHFLDKCCPMLERTQTSPPALRLSHQQKQIEGKKQTWQRLGKSSDDTSNTSNAAW